VLSLASLAFYALGEWRFLGWLVASVALNYWIRRGIELSRGTRKARAFLALGVVSDLLLLVFKYGDSSFQV
jgi:alginate O-acetyltransferase complex protein AlgI